MPGTEAGTVRLYSISLLSLLCPALSQVSPQAAKLNKKGIVPLLLEEAQSVQIMAQTCEIVTVTTDNCYKGKRSRECQ